MLYLHNQVSEDVVCKICRLTKRAAVECTNTPGQEQLLNPKKWTYHFQDGIPLQTLTGFFLLHSFCTRFAQHFVFAWQSLNLLRLQQEGEYDLTDLFKSATDH